MTLAINAHEGIFSNVVGQPSETKY